MKNDARGDKALVMTSKFTSLHAGDGSIWREPVSGGSSFRRKLQTHYADLEVVIVISRPRLWKRIHREAEIDTGR